jgi:hypothetical protein
MALTLTFARRARRALEGTPPRLKRYRIRAPWTVESLALHTQAVLQGAFILAKAKDGATVAAAIILEPDERAMMLREMREFVAGLQFAADALSRDDMPGVAKASRGMGTARAHDVPIAMMGKLPLEFKTLALGTHRDFDGIAADAGANGTPKHTLAQLADFLRKCVACHAGYQIHGATTQ